TVLALHGGPGFDHAYFKPALSGLADTAQLVYIDLRGQGRSGRPPVETCTLEQMADDAAAFCRTLGIMQPIVLGHSAGGFVALHLAVRHPDLVSRLILIDTAAATADMGDAMGELERRCGAEARAAAERVFGGDASEAAMADFGRLVFPAYVGDPAKVATVMEAVGRSSFNPEVASAYFRHQAARYDLRDELGKLRLPCLVIVGDRDWLLPPSASRVMAAGIPRAGLVVVPGAGHFPFLEQSDVIAEAVRHFLGAVAVA
ncbi:MAG: alpha/beta fold hydrolase, partial [Dehalococcoidia bacterium]